MKNTKTIPVVEKRANTRAAQPVVAEPEMGCPCHANEGAGHCCEGCGGCHGGCHSSGLLKSTLLLGSIWGAAFVVAASILATSPATISTPTVRPTTAPVAQTSDAAIKKFIETNPQVILDSVNKHLAAQQKAAEEAEAKEPQVAPADIVAEIIADKSNYSLGNPNGKFVIIEFFDHQCGWCKRTNAALYEALAKAENKNIRWIPIDTPIFGEKSQEIARFVLAAGKQGKYAEMHHAVGEEKGGISRDVLIKIGETLKLDTKKLAADADSDEIKNKLEANQKYARQLNINGVPMLIVNGKVNPGALLGERLDAALEEARNMK